MLYDKDTDDDGHYVTIEIGQARAYTIDLDSTDNVGTDLDDVSADLSLFAATVFERNEVVGDLMAQFDMPHYGILILDNITLEEEYRGHGLGPWVAGTLIDVLSGRLEGYSLVLCHPSPPGADHSDPNHELAVTALCRTWAKVGFKPFRDGVWFLDLRYTHFERSWTKVKADLGLLV